VVARVVGLETVAELAGEDGDRAVSVSATLRAVLDDGRRVTLLDDRGWTQSGAASGMEEQEATETARVVVGPDEPFEGHTQESMASDHWGALAARLGDDGVSVDADELSRLPHEVVLGPTLQARLRRRDT
jgi:hypothetical protein